MTDSLPEHASRTDVEVAVRSAFASVRLGQGVSLRVAEMIDEWADPALVESLLGTEPEHDWQSIPASELDRAEAIAHLDAEGLRYYLPALMLHLLDAYRSTGTRSIGTIAALDQRARHPPGFMELLDAKQREAIATYVKALPHLVRLSYEDSTRMGRAFDDVWSRYLPGQQ